MTDFIYKILREAEYAAASQTATFTGAAVDLQDGFIHFSTHTQLEETAARYFSKEQNIIILEFSADGFGPKLKWEPSRGGDLFPHLYDTLDIHTATRHWKVAGPVNNSPDFSFINKGDTA